MKEPRTSLLVRLSTEDAARIHHAAASEYRSLCAYLLRHLERSMALEEKGTGKPSETLKELLFWQALQAIGPQRKKQHTAIHLYCTLKQATRIRACAARRQLSISDFVVFSLRRSWTAMDSLGVRR